MRRLIILLATASAGCSSIITTFAEENYFGPWPFCGTITDVKLLGGGLAEVTDHAGVGAIYAVLVAFDLPFSLAMDLVLLPWTIVKQLMCC